MKPTVIKTGVCYAKAQYAIMKPCLCMQVKERMQANAAASTSAPTLDIPWEAQFALCKLLIYRAGQADGDQNSPGLALLFEDAAFAKLSGRSQKVQRARTLLKSWSGSMWQSCGAET